MPDQPDADGPDDNSKTQAEPAQPVPARPAAQPDQSAEDTDIGWGDRPDPDHDERFYQDRPPHWGSD
jgi:hypothetical protein